MTLRSLLYAVLLLAAAPVFAASPDAIVPNEAFSLKTAGKLTIVDIRTPPEWKQTGIPEGAKAIDMQSRTFLPQVLNALNEDKSAPLAVICRTGRRSAIVTQFLKSRGFTNVRDISEGMAGGPDGPGWLARSLPVEAWTN